MKLTLVCLIAATMLTGCVSFGTTQATTINFDPATMELVGPVAGESSATLFLGIGELPTIREAIGKALKTSGSQAVINICTDEQEQIALGGLIQILTIHISGQGIRFKKSVYSAY